MKRRVLKQALFLCMIALLAVPRIALGADNSMNGFLVADQTINYGNGAVDKSLGSLMAWGQAYGIDAYMDMYETTGATEWLDKVIDQTDEADAAAADNGSGYKGWSESKYSHIQTKNGYFYAPVIGAAAGATELVTNGSFDTDLSGWNQLGNTAMTYRSTAAGDAYSGAAGLIVESDGTNENKLTQNLSYTPGAKYVVEVYSGLVTQQSEGYVEICRMVGSHCSQITTALIGQVGYERTLFNFTAPPDSGTLQLRLGLFDNNYLKSGYKIRYDDVSVKQVASDPAEIVQNNGFETKSGGDPTLPANWSRYQADSSTAYLVSGINKAYSGNNGAAVTTNNTDWKVLEQTISYTPSQSYAVSFNGRVSDNRYGGRVEIFNETDSVVLSQRIFYNTDYGKSYISFTAPAVSGKTLKIRLYTEKYTNSGTSFFDNISIKPVQQKEAAGWTHAGVALSNAHLTNLPVAGSYNDWMLELIHNGVTNPQMSQYVLNYKPLSKYRFVANAQVTPGATGAIRIYDETSGTTLGSMTITNSGTFNDSILSFDTPAAGHMLRADIYMPSGSNGDKLYMTMAKVSLSMNFMVHDGMIGASMLRFVNDVYANPNLPLSYKSKADAYRNFVADNLFHKYDSDWRQITGTDGSNNGTGLYLFPEFSDDLFGGRSLPHNQYLAFARMLYLLYDATNGVPAYAANRSMYWSRANDMMRAFKTTIKEGTEVYVPETKSTVTVAAYASWHYWDSMGSWDDGFYYNIDNEDISHASITMKSVLEAYHHGQVFTLDDMQKFTRTFTEVMWNQSLSDPVMSSINKNRPTTTYDKLQTLETYFWVAFAEFDQKVWDINNAICRDGSYCNMPTGAGLAKWSRNKVVNGGMEVSDATDSTLPLGWARWQSTSTTAYRDNGNPYLDQYSATVKTNGAAGWQVLEQQLKNFEPNTSYTVSFAGKTNGNVGGQVDVLDVTSSSQLNKITFTDTSWANKSLLFTTPAAASDNVKVRLYQDAFQPVNGVANYDQVRALPYLYNSHIPNSSFEVADRFDTTLPRYWTRGATTTAADVKLDSTNVSSGSKSIMLTTDSASGAQELQYDWKGYKKNGAYTLTVKGKTNGVNGNGRIKVIDTSNGNAVLANILINNASWTTYTASFTAPTIYNHILKVTISHDNPSASNGTLWVDDLGIYLN